MAVTSNSTHPDASLHDAAPAVVNLRRPRASDVEASTALHVARPAARDEQPLPPTVLRLPNLATMSRSVPSGWTVSSIAHWTLLALGALLALWLIFGGRGGPKPSGEDLPAAPSRAQADASPAWNPPPLATAGESEAPAWTPPPAAAAPAATSAQPAVPAMAPSGPPLPEAPDAARFEPSAAPTGQPPAADAPAAADVPEHESWPRAGGSSGAAPPGESGRPDLPQWDDPSSVSSVEPPAGPEIRTAQLPARPEAPPADELPGGEAQPLGITVAVPQ